ncbi:hypothetical protein AS189_18490 [Arthrobacter alpinus]|uniref:1,4-beta-xylanase n=1 Tax=Arthrobacter alpinus TaxID=656366 RepID=A0A0S2M3I8_9MICC|nr:glycoside hydrolase family 43 protein [Arthrobacter alpinus]ALO68120.1 hypothetical protein AS189_18490 [Arthrobacter alpinus]
MSEAFGYLLVHFVEDPLEHKEKIYLSLSEGDDPLSWRRLNGGAAVLESLEGTGGVRDPNIVRGPDGTFHILATDLRVWRPEGPDWWEFRHRGSLDVVMWDSTDLITWSEPRYVRIAPDGAGMAWAPKSVYDPVSGDFLVFWSSGLQEAVSPEPVSLESASLASAETGPSKILVSRTKDFVGFTAPEVYLDLPGGVIDMTLLVTDTAVHRLAKHDDDAPLSLQLFHQRGSSVFADDFITVAKNVGHEISPHVEGPLVFRHNHENRWYLWVDRYADMPQGYHAYSTTNLESGDWKHVPGFTLPENTKHGAVLPLQGDEYRNLDAFYPR